MPPKLPRLSPSKLELISKCPGAPTLCLPFPFVTSPAAERGKELHRRTSILVRVGSAAVEKMKEGISEGDFAAVSMCVEIGRELTPPGEHVTYNEEEIDLGFLGMPSGTPDLAFYHASSGVVTVLDWKFGRGLIQDPAENVQLIAYGLGIARKVALNGCRTTRLLLGIVQPANVKLESFRTAVIEGADFKTWTEKIEGWVELAKNSPVPVPGWHCQKLYCEAAKHSGGCPAFEEWHKTLAEAKRDKTLDLQADTSGIDSRMLRPISLEEIKVDEEIVARARALEAKCLSVKVTDEGSAREATEILSETTKLESLLKKNKDEVKAPIIAAGKKVETAFSEVLEPLGAGKAFVKGELSGYETRKLQEAEAAKKKAEAEREKAEAEARKAEEDKRKAEEAQLRAEKEKLEAEERARKAEEDAKNAKGKAAKEKAAREKAEAEAALLRAQEESRKAEEEAKKAQEEEVRISNIPAPVEVVEEAASVKGLSKGMDFELEPIENWALGSVPPEYLLLNEKGIRAALKAGVLKGSETWLRVRKVVKVSARGRV